MIPAVAFQNITIESSTAASVSAFSIPANTSIVVNKTTIAEPIVASTISSDTEEDFNQVAGETSTVAIVEATKSPKAHGSHGDSHEGKNKSKEKKSGEKKSGEKKSREE
ncbi:hypothetical protein L596_028296 [Steinernema carpocapsae]|uniref:Uncharacterized protein n=1 Tax=Steinernema carpocapsae TaxID=34508 RepID=A0A4U5LXZ9_STECR|nr:hypothetical protein L596_028296 [Steinernema carpocapsae]